MRKSPVFLFSLILISVFLAELLGSQLSQRISFSAHQYIETLILLLVLFPALYFFYYIPLEKVSGELKDINQKLTTANEELEIGNEELQTRSEEYESANEELSITTEDLRKINQELTAANLELNRKNKEIIFQRSLNENIVNSISSAIVVLDDNLGVILVNRGHRTFFERGDDGMIKLTIRDFSDYAVLEKSGIIKQLKIIIDNGGSFKSTNIKYRTAYIGERIIDLQAIYMQASKNILLVIDDITEEYLLREKEKFLANIVKTTSNAIEGMDADGNITFWNPGAEKMFGFREKEILNNHYSALVPSDEKGALKKIFEKVREKGMIAGYETECVSKSGEHIPVHVTLNALYNNKKELDGFCAIISDLTEIKKREIEISTINENLTDLTFKLSRVMEKVVKEKSFNVRFDNPHLQKCWIELKCRSNDCPAYESDDLRCWLVTGTTCNNGAQVINDKLEKCLECRVYISARPDIYFEIGENFNTMLAILEEEDKLSQDLTNKLMHAEKLLALSEMTAGVAHEINNPLSSILGFSELSLEQGCSPEIKSNLQLILESARRCKKIIHNMLIFARNHECDRRLDDINNVLKTAVRMAMSSLEDSNIKIIKSLSDDVPKTLFDPTQMEQVFTNIIINSCQALEGVSYEGEIRVSTSLDDSSSHIIIEFTDNGPGIPQKIMNKIFDPFFTTKETGRGTGLGLSICHGIISSHGGKIVAKNLPRGGSRFVIELPLMLDTIPAPESAENPCAENSLKGKRVLVVDDESNIRVISEKIFEREGCETTTLGRGEDAVADIRNNDYDVIILDVKMPGMGGIETYREIEEIKPYLVDKIIFSSGNVNDGEVRKFVRRTGVSVLAKPFDIHSLLSTVSKILNPTLTGGAPG